MILSDKTIRALLDQGLLKINPLDDDQINKGIRVGQQIQPASVDLKLGRHFLKLDEHNVSFIDLEHPAKYISIESDELLLESVSIDSTATTLALTPERVWFDEQTIFIDVYALPYSSASRIRLNISLRHRT